MSDITIVLAPNTGKDDDVRGLIQHCGTKGNVHATISESINEHDEHSFLIVFDSNACAKVFIYEWFYAMSVPEHDFTSLTKSEVAFEATDQELINHISSNIHRSVHYDVDLLDQIVSEIAYDNEHTKSRVKAIEEYMKGSGIVYYKQFMDELLTALDQQGILNKESVLTKMVRTFH
jgi:nitrogen regulatory protein PII